MKKVYLVRCYKFFYSEGDEYQMANCGETPYVFSSKKTAEKFLYSIARDYEVDKTEIHIFPYMYFETRIANNRIVYTLQEAEVITMI